MSSKNRPLNSAIMERFMTGETNSHEEDVKTVPGTDDSTPKPASQNNILPEAEKIIILSLDDVVPYEGHIFTVKDDDREMRILKTSISHEGQQQPIVVRPKSDGKYEIISGHRRCRALTLLGKKTVKAIVAPLHNDLLAEIVMMDTNAGTREIPPCERGEMYRRRTEALKKLSREDDLSVWEKAQVQKNEEKYSRRSVYNYMSLTRLTPRWKELVDSEAIHMMCGVHLSELSHEDQEQLYSDLGNDVRMSVPQAKKIKDAYKSAGYNKESVMAIMGRLEKATPAVTNVSFKREEIPACYLHLSTAKDMKIAMIKDGASWRTLVDILGEEAKGMTNEELLSKLLRRLNS